MKIIIIIIKQQATTITYVPRVFILTMAHVPGDVVYLQYDQFFLFPTLH